MLPDKFGKFGVFGGKFVPETLMMALEELEKEYKVAQKDTKFKKELDNLLEVYAGRPTPLYLARNISKKIGRKIYLKREDLLHTGAHKINNTLGQALLAVKMGKRRIIAETGAGQHGLATATSAALFGLTCDVYMGEEDIHRQSLNVFKMKLLGARVIPVYSGSKTLKDATSEAIRDWVTNVRNTYYIIGSAIGPHPYPMIVRDFQSVIGKETKKQFMKYEKKLPDYMVACVGGGSNAMGFFYPFSKKGVGAVSDRPLLIGVEAGGLGINTEKHGASLSKGSIGILHGTKSYLLQDEFGQVKIAHSISAGLDYPGVGPEHSYYKDTKRAEYTAVTDKEALQGFKMLTEFEGIIPALESSHAIYYAVKKLAPKISKNKIIAVCLSGRGDKDIDIIRNTNIF